VASAVAKHHGFEPLVFVLTRDALKDAVKRNPFEEAVESPASVHLFFLEELPEKPDVKMLDSLKAKSERFALKGSVFYLHTPDGFGKSKLAARVERALGVAATARNWRTVTTLLEMTAACAAE
jgi:uncharacterized protein (DUF1697 family)